MAKTTSRHFPARLGRWSRRWRVAPKRNRRGRVLGALATGVAAAAVAAAAVTVGLRRRTHPALVEASPYR